MWRGPERWGQCRLTEFLILQMRGYAFDFCWEELPRFGWSKPYPSDPLLHAEDLSLPGLKARRIKTSQAKLQFFKLSLWSKVSLGGGPLRHSLEAYVDMQAPVV